MTHYRWNRNHGRYVDEPGEWHEFRTLAVLDAIDGGGVGDEDEIEMRQEPTSEDRRQA